LEAVLPFITLDNPSEAEKPAPPAEESEYPKILSKKLRSGLPTIAARPACLKGLCCNNLRGGKWCFPIRPLGRRAKSRYCPIGDL
jgi:hypothetical protein